MVKVTLVKSPLGLTKLNSSKTFEDSATLRGKLKKVAHLVKVEEE